MKVTLGRAGCRAAEHVPWAADPASTGQPGEGLSSTILCRCPRLNERCRAGQEGSVARPHVARSQRERGAAFPAVPMPRTAARHWGFSTQPPTAGRGHDTRRNPAPLPGPAAAASPPPARPSPQRFPRKGWRQRRLWTRGDGHNFSPSAEGCRAALTSRGALRGDPTTTAPRAPSSRPPRPPLAAPHPWHTWAVPGGPVAPASRLLCTEME